MKEIPVGKNGAVALVDDEDYDALREHYWGMSPTGYAMTVIGRKALYMHRLILQVPKGLECHHRNGNTLDNQRHNLRLCTHGQNMAARRMHSDNKVGYLGVTKHGYKTIRYLASICKDHVIYRLGQFDTPEKAARAYDRAARDLHGDMARLNFPDEL